MARLISSADICIETGFVYLYSAGRLIHFRRFSTLPNKKHSTSGPDFILTKTLCFRPTGKGQDLGKGHDNISLTLSLSQAVSSRR